MAIKKPLVIIGGQIQELPADSDLWLSENGSPVSTEDENIHSLLSRILREIRIMNVHLTSITGERVTKDDMEDV